MCVANSVWRGGKERGKKGVYELLFPFFPKIEKSWKKHAQLTSRLYFTT
jgi:hypothetical protein